MDKTFLILLEQTRLARERAEEAGRQLEDFCNCSTTVGKRITADGIRGKGRHSDPTAHAVLGRIALEQNFNAAVSKLVECRAQVEQNIDADPLPEMKRVLYWRLICEHSWDEVCARMGAKYTVRGLQRAIRLLIVSNDQGRWRKLLQRAL